MTGTGRQVRRSHDRRVTVSWPPDAPVRLFIHEVDGSTGEVDLHGLVAGLARLGLGAPPPSSEGVELGWLEGNSGARFYVDGRRLPQVAGLELVAAGVVEAIREALVSPKR